LTAISDSIPKVIESPKVEKVATPPEVARGSSGHAVDLYLTDASISLPSVLKVFRVANSKLRCLYSSQATKENVYNTGRRTTTPTRQDGNYCIPESHVHSRTFTLACSLLTNHYHGDITKELKPNSKPKRQKQTDDRTQIPKPQNPRSALPKIRRFDPFECEPYTIELVVI
jgi:hypothetical protein